MSGILTARFDTRREAELAVEHLVQQEGVPREDITVLPVGSLNSAGVERSGSDNADAQPASRERDDAALTGQVEVSVRTSPGMSEDVKRALASAGAQDSSES